MKMISTFIFIASWLLVNAQTMGVVDTPDTKAKLEVENVLGLGPTIGLFGNTANGVSLQRNWPTLGFNQYRDDFIPGSQGKYIQNGFAATQYLDINTGTYAFDLFPNGTADSYITAGTRGITMLTMEILLYAPTKMALL